MKTKMLVLVLVLLMAITPVMSMMHGSMDNTGIAQNTRAASVSFNEPSDGEYFKGGTDIDISVSYNAGWYIDPDTGERKLDDAEEVNIYFDGTQIYSSSPKDNSGTVSTDYTLPTPEGSHTLEAEVVPGMSQRVSTTITIYIDNTAPSCSITAPTSGQWVHGNVELQADATDNNAISHVDFYVDGSKVGTDSSSPYTYSWDSTSTSEGQHSVYAIAYDKAGNSKQSSTVDFNVDNTPPTISWVAPSSGSYVSGTITLQSTASDDKSGMNKVVYYYDNVSSSTEIGSSTNSGNDYSVSFDTTTVSTGDHTIYAVAYDNVGNTASQTITLHIDNSPPSVSISSPTSTYIRGTVVITADASDSGIAKVVFYEDSTSNTPLGTDTSSPYQATWNAAGESGTHTIYAVAYNNAGLSKTTSRTYTVDNDAPIITISTPTGGEAYSGTVYINATASDSGSGVASMSLSIDSSQITSSNSGSISYLWDTTTVSDGNHQITVSAQDNAGNTNTETITITVDNTPPEPFNLSAPANNTLTNTKSIDFSWQEDQDTSGGSGIDTYTLVIWNTTSGAYYNQTGLTTNYKNGVPLPNDGKYGWYVIAYDKVGNARRSSQVYYLTIDTTGVAVSLSVSNNYFSPNGDGHYDTTTLTASTKDGSTVSWYVEIYSTSNVLEKTYKPADSSSFSWTWDGTNTYDSVLTTGTYTFKVYAKDNAGNNNSFTISTTIDLNPPTSFSLSSPSDGAYVNTSTPLFSWASSGDGESGLMKYQLFISTSAPSNYLTANYVYNITSGQSLKIPDSLPDGTYYWWVVAWDNVYNYRVDTNSGSNSYWKLTIDTTPPTFDSVSVSPYWYSPNGDGFHDTLYINATASESVSWNVEIYYQGNETYPFPSTTGTLFVQRYGGQLNYGDGQYYVLFTITDNAGNTATKTVYFVQDTTPMAKPVLEAPANHAYLNSSTVQFSWNNAPSDTTTNSWWKDWFELYDDSGHLIDSSNFTARGTSGMQYSYILPDGVYQYHVIRYDKAGNVVDSGYYTFTVDTTPPTRPVLLAPADSTLTNADVINFTWQASNDATPLTYYLNLYYASTGQPYHSYSTTVNYYNLNVSSISAQQAFIWNVSVVDSAGNGNISANTWHLSIDHDIPTFNYTISNHYITPNNDGRLDELYINTTSTSNGGENLKWEFIISNATGVVEREYISSGYTSTYTWVWNGKDNSGNVVLDSKYTIKIDAFDPAGNKRTATTWVIVDTVAPAVPMITAPANDLYSNSSAINITWTPFNDTNITVAKLNIYNSTGIYESLSLSMGDYYYKVLCPDGHYYAQLMVEDIAGNQNLSNAVHFTIDTTAPSNFNLLTPANHAYANYTALNFTWSNTIDTNFDHYTLVLAYNSSVYEYNTTANYTMLDLPEGEYNVSWYVVAWDKANNTESTTVNMLYIDTVAPRNLTNLAPAGLVNDTNNITFTWNAVSDAYFANYTLYMLYQNGTEFFHQYLFSPTDNRTTIWIPNGFYKWYVVAWDKAGNKNISLVENLTIDTDAPYGLLSLNSTYGTLNITIRMYAYDNTTGVGYFRYAIDNGSWSGWISFASEYVIDIGTAGIHNVSVQFKDNAGHVSPVYTEQTMVSTAPPSVNFEVENATATQGYNNTTGWSNITLSINGTSETGMSQMRILIYNESGGLVFDSGWIDYNSTYLIHLSESGYYNITVYVKDHAGLTANATQRIYEDLSAPAISNIDFEHYIAFANETNITINATDFSGIARWGYELNGTMHWFDNSTFTIMLPITEGNYTLTLYVQDIFGNVAQRQIWLYEIQHRPTGTVSVQQQLLNNDTIIVNLFGTDKVFTVVGVYVKVDNGNWVYYNYTTQLHISVLNDGNHTIYVKYMTQQGVESKIYATWAVVDTAPPETEIISHIPQYTNATSITIVVQGNDTLLGFAYYKVYVKYNGGAWGYIGVYLPNQTTLTISLLHEGTYSIAIVGYDKAGNHESLKAKATIVVDRIAPTLVIKGNNETLTNTFYYNLSWNATDNTGIAYYLIYIYKGNLTRAEPWKVINTTATSISVRLDDNATYTIEIRAYDDAGNYVQRAVKVSENYNYPPSIEKTDIPQNATAGEETTFYADAYDVKGDTLNYTWLIGNKTVGYGQYLKYKFPKAGSYNLTLIVSDGVHNITRTWNITVAQSSIHSRGGSSGSLDIFMGLILPILLFIGLLVLVLLLLVFMMKKRKKGGEEREEELSEEELAILNDIKRFLEQHNGEKIDVVVKAVANKMNVHSNDVLLVLDYGVSKGIFTKEMDADGNVRVFLTSSKIEVEKSKGESGGS